MPKTDRILPDQIELHPYRAFRGWSMEYGGKERLKARLAYLHESRVSHEGGVGGGGAFENIILCHMGGGGLIWPEIASKYT